MHHCCVPEDYTRWRSSMAVENPRYEHMTTSRMEVTIEIDCSGPRSGHWTVDDIVAQTTRETLALQISRDFLSTVCYNSIISWSTGQTMPNHKRTLEDIDEDVLDRQSWVRITFLVAGSTFIGYGSNWMIGVGVFMIAPMFRHTIYQSVLLALHVFKQEQEDEQRRKDRSGFGGTGDTNPYH